MGTLVLFAASPGMVAKCCCVLDSAGADAVGSTAVHVAWPGAQAAFVAAVSSCRASGCSALLQGAFCTAAGYRECIWEIIGAGCRPPEE
jgi:hypothetical protein